MKLTQTCIGLVAAVCLTQSAGAADIRDEKLSDGAMIIIDGEISNGDLEKFRQLSVRHRRAVVVLNSPGGALLPAIEIGKIIKIAGFITAIPRDASCASSCALIWLAGESRLLSRNGQVGFHASYRDNNGKLEESGVANALIGSYLSKLNLSERGIIFATSAPPDKITWLTRTNKGAAGIDFTDLEDEESTANPSPAQKSQRAVSPPPIQTTTARPANELPSSLPASLSQIRSRWVQYAGNAYYDASSIELVTDIYGNRAGRKFWVVIDHSSDPKWKYAYSVVKKFVYCPSQSVSVYSWTDYKKDGTAKRQEVSTRGVPAEPGTVERVLADMVCPPR